MERPNLEAFILQAMRANLSNINPPLEKAGSDNGANWIVPFERSRGFK